MPSAESAIWKAQKSFVRRPDLAAVVAVSPTSADLRAFEEVIRPPSFRLLTAGTAAEAAVLMRKVKVPVIIAPCRSGDALWKQVVQLVHSVRKRPLPRVILVADAVEERLWANAGAFDELARPFEHEELLWAITDAWCDWQRELQWSGRSSRRQVRKASAAA